MDSERQNKVKCPLISTFCALVPHRIQPASNILVLPLLDTFFVPGAIFGFQSQRQKVEAKASGYHSIESHYNALTETGFFFLSTGAQKVAGLQFPGDSTKRKNIEVIIKRKTLNCYSSGGDETPEPGPPFSSQLLIKYKLTSDTIAILSNKISK